MAGDWIKMRTDLADDPAVIAIAARLEVEEDYVVGKLHRLWSWANRQTEDGNASGVTLAWLDRYLGVTGFAQACAEVGWLVQTEGGILIPKFDRHNSESAKRRALTANRVADHRKRKRNAKSVTREEKRREEKKEPPVPPFDDIDFPPGLDVAEVRAAISEWLEYKRRRGQGYKDPARQIAKLLSQDWCVSPAAFVAAVNHSIAQNYQGCFPAKGAQDARADRPSGRHHQQTVGRRPEATV